MINNDEQLVKDIVSLLIRDELTGRAFEDGCIDGYELHYIILAKEILNRVNCKLLSEQLSERFGAKND